MKATAPLTLASTHRRAEETPPPADLYVEPEEDLLVLGEMLHDAATMGEMLRELPYSRLDYRGNLRVVRGAAVRMADRCAKLLGETAPANKDTREHAKAVLAKELAAINVVDASPEQAQAADEETGEYTVTVDDPEAPHRSELREEVARGQNSHSTRKNRSDRPKETGIREFTIVESHILGEIKARGRANTTELLKALVMKHGIASDLTNDALGALRKEGYVVTSRAGRGFTNELGPEL